VEQKQCSSCHWWLRDDESQWGTCSWGQHHLPSSYVRNHDPMRIDDGRDCAMWKQVGQDNAEDH